MSLPSRERGLKPDLIGKTEAGRKSLPSRERGLKPYSVYIKNENWFVAPFTGAWIETALSE